MIHASGKTTISQAAIRILLIDDDDDAYVITKSLLEDIPDQEYRLDFVYRYEDAVIEIMRDEHDVYLVDFFLGPLTGLNLIEEVRTKGCIKPIICVTTMENRFVDLSIMKAGASDYLIKGEMSSALLERSIRYSIANQRALNEVQSASHELRLLNKELQESKAELMELNKAKDQFFSIISHDLKSPFTSLLGFSELLVNCLDNLTDDQIRESAQRIYSSGRNLYGLLENLLQWSRLQAGRAPFNPIAINLHSLASQVFALYRDMADQKNVSIQNSMSADIVAFADPTMLQTILENLVSNALKFTPSGGRVEIASEPAQRGVYITVTDDGIGIDDSDLPRLFKIDSHHSTLGTDSEEGTGLGLLICHEMIKRNNGTISVTSTRGKGTTFIIHLPHDHDPRMKGGRSAHSADTAGTMLESELVTGASAS
jgi:signal transduction histidine kinase